MTRRVAGTGLLLAALLLFAGALRRTPREPSLESIDPSGGPARGRRAIVLRGEGLAGHGGVTVYFGDAPARGVDVRSDQTIVLIPPPIAEAGSYDVTLEFADGSVARLDAAYTVQAGARGGLQVTPI